MGGSPISAALARHPGAAPALLGPGGSVTFSDLRDRISLWANLLTRAGIGGEMVALGTGNSPAFVELFFALREIGSPVLLLDEGLNGSTEVCRAMRARHLLHRGEGEELPGGPDPSVRLRDLGDNGSPPAGTALVKLTSGSALRPRGACFTQEALMEGIDHIVRGMDVTAADRVLISIPLSHSYGFDNGILSLAALGTPLVLQPDVMPAAVLDALRRWEVTFFPAVPALLRALSGVAWPRPLALRKVISASAVLAPEVAREFAGRSGLAVHQFYGATECGGITFELRPDDPLAAGCVGSPLPGVRVEIDGEGCVQVHSKANRFALLPDSPVTSFVETGDRASFTPEGRLRLLGRTQEVANIGGFKVDLATINQFLMGIPGVRDAAVVAADDAARGHRLVAFVETREHTPADLFERCRARLSAREVPSEIRVVERLARTARGKLDMAVLLMESQ